ncbi:proline-rich transmembrane protein 3 [Salarias fasciatus]|uniref:Proline-rich transmembrane protein 3/4 domain-containing protein n=1 Tax=Salarias fasciatus TaxID=181472 RepID=A0A672HYH8_SALFA|nr:proline-rich transmembrane protein 3 [Salarias fasciatus]XP_029974220.1 proline-rich transmembrane protein 3 [Salarias fasciatus]
MAPIFLLIPALLLLSCQFSDAQTVIGSSSSFSSLDAPKKTLPSPTKQPAGFWPSLPPRGRSDVPIRVTGRSRSTTANAVDVGQSTSHTSPQFTASFTSALSTQNLSRGSVVAQPTASRPRTDTSSLASSRAFTKRDTTTKPPTLPTVPFTAPPKPEDHEQATISNPEEETMKDTEDEDSQGSGSGGTPTAKIVKENSPSPPPTVADEMAQHRPPAQTVISQVSDVKSPSPESQTVNPHLLMPTPTSTTRTIAATPETTTETTVATEQTPQIKVITGELAADTPPTDRGHQKQDSAAVTSPRPASNATRSSDKLLQTVTSPSRRSSQVHTTRPQTTTASTAGGLTASQTTVRTSPKATATLGKTAQSGQTATSVEPPRTGSSSVITSSLEPVTGVRFGPTNQPGMGQRNRSLMIGHPHQAPHSTTDPAPSPSAGPYFNGTRLYWGDLSRTLAFAWELHVYGSASLFLLLFAGAALGLTLSPSTNCPHRGALALANAFLFLAGGLRATLFFVDPYGTRKLLPHSAVTALYNLPLHLLVWTQATLALLALRAAGISVLPSTLERPPLVAVLAVLQCTLLLAADLLSPALSPVVPVTLQVLSLCWGLGLCLGFLCYVFPRIRCPALPHPGAPEESRRKAWVGSRRLGVILARVLAACAVLGALCCGLHVHATFWLYGLLGDWIRFNWGWWLVHFWARLLELAWGFSLLVLSSWVFWRPRDCRGREEEGQDSRVGGDLPSPGQSVNSNQRHTCWSKIVQSLKGRPSRKSDSNGVGGGIAVPGEVPNNWAGQERPGADISKSLIRNQNHEQAIAPPRCVKDSNRGRNHRGHSAERGISDGSTGSLLRLQALGLPPQRSVSGSLDQDRDTSLSLYDFDLRPPSPIDLTRSIDEALHREHLLGTGSLFHPLNQPSPSPSPGSGASQGPWLRRNSDPQLLSDSSDAPTESSMPLGGSVLSSVPSRQVTAPPTPSHQGHRWAGNGLGSVPSSVSCPVSLRPSRTSSGHLEDGVDDTRPFITPDSERVPGRAAKPVGSRSYLEVSRHEDSASVSSEIIDL